MTTHKSTINKNLLLTSMAISMALAGCASTQGPNSNDDWHGWNHGAQQFNDTVDKNVLKPVAKGYDAITPKIVDEGITNFFSNLNDVGVTVNDLLQLKFLQGGMDLSRFIINTTAGVGGFIDVAKMVDLPKHNEDFGQTLGFWGVPSGPYLVLPFYGPSSPRDFVGIIGDAALNPLTYVSIFGGWIGGAVSGGARAVDVVDTRASLMTTEKVVNEGSVNRYDFIKNAYEQRREYLIHDGNPPSNDVDDLDDDTDSSSGTGSQSGKTGSSSSAPAKMGNTISNQPMSPSKTAPLTTQPYAQPNVSQPKHTLKLTAPADVKK